MSGPSVKTETGFEWADFLKHVGSAFSNLIYQDQQAVEREVAPKLKDENDFAAFYCPGCGGVVRIYFIYENLKKGSLRLVGIETGDREGSNRHKTELTLLCIGWTRWKSRKLVYWVVG